MQKVYDIKISQLTTLLKTLKQYSGDRIVDIDILRLEGYIDRLKNNFSESCDLTLLEQLFNDGDYVEFYKPFYIFSETFANSGLDVQDISVHEWYTKIKLNDEKVLNDADEFYRSKGDFFYLPFLEFKQEANDHLKFFKPTKGSCGEALTLKSTGEAFVFVPNYSNITKFTILVHETEHALDFYNNPDFFDMYVLREIAAIFMELLACDFSVQKYGIKSDGIRRKAWIHQVVKNQAAILAPKIEMLDIVNRNRFLDEDKMLQLLDDEGFEKDYVKYLLESTISEDFSYQLPYFIAVELYTIYYKNKNLALKILEEIIMFGNPNNILDILSNYGIALGKNSVKYEKTLFKGLKN